MLQARGLHRLDLPPLDFGLAAGECAGVTGPSGSGKTVLLRMLADLDPHDGEVFLDGDAQAAVAPCAWRRRVALLPAESRWWGVTVGEHFDDGVVPGFDELGFDEDPGGWPVERLSSGERQRLALARVLALEPRVLLLDEPTANLDDANAARVERLIDGWRRTGDRAALWVGHDIAQLARVAGRLLTLPEGRWSTVR